MSGSQEQPPKKMSSQMEAVMRIMTGKEERTIAEKLADSNRPTWEQYKKDNEDKLNLEGVDQKKMEEYRKELDAERERILARGTNHRSKRKKKKRRKRKYESDSEDSDGDDSDDDSDSGGSEEEAEDERKKRRRKHKKKKRKKRRRKHDGSEDSADSYEERKRRKKKKSKRKGDEKESDDRYRLSNFFSNKE